MCDDSVWHYKFSKISSGDTLCWWAHDWISNWTVRTRMWLINTITWDRACLSIMDIICPVDWLKKHIVICSWYRIHNITLKYLCKKVMHIYRERFRWEKINHSITKTTSDSRLSHTFRHLSTGHCRSQFWLGSISPYCVTRPQCINALSSFWRKCASLLQIGALRDMGMAHCWIYTTGLLCVSSGCRPYWFIRPQWVTKAISYPNFQGKFLL